MQTPSAAVAPGRELRYDLWLDLSVIAANVALSTAIMVSEPGPSRCRWSERGDLNAVDRWFQDSLRDPDAPFRKTVGRLGALLLPLSENESFLSGHTTLVFSFAVSSGTVASMRGHRRAPVVWMTGLTLAALVAYPRMVADEHHFTDLLAGAVAGSTADIPRIARWHRHSIMGSCLEANSHEIHEGTSCRFHGWA